MLIDIADLEQWEACSIHFPNLHSLVLKYCKHLNEIPIGIGDINTLQLIELWACSTSAYDSAERIQEEQQNSGNDGLTVRIHRVHNGKWQSIFFSICCSKLFLDITHIILSCPYLLIINVFMADEWHTYTQAPLQQRILKWKYKLSNSPDDLNLGTHYFLQYPLLCILSRKCSTKDFGKLPFTSASELH